MRTQLIQRATPVPELTLTAMVSIYNSSEWLQARIDNLMETSLYKSGQLLIFCANAQSPDPQDNLICERYAGAKHFHYEILDSRLSVYATWNHIIKKTTTPFLTNANSDDLCHPESYSTLINLCNQHKASLAYADWYTIGANIKSWSQIQGTAGNASPYNPDQDMMSCGHFPVWRRTVHEKIGLFDGSFQALGDCDLWLRMWKNDLRNIFFCNAPLYAYRWRDGQNLWNRTSEEQRTHEWDTLRNRPLGRLEF